MKRSYLNFKEVKIDLYVIIFLIFFSMFIMRLISIVIQSPNYSKLIYREILNFTLPVVENNLKDNEDYMEDGIIIDNLYTEALGVNNITAFLILENELSLLKQNDLQNYSVDKPSSDNYIHPFELSENSVIKVPKENINDSNLKKPLNKVKPEVLIYHTHTTEGYIEGGPQNNNAETNVVGVGDLLKKELEEKYGISVVHAKTNHSLSYNSSYQRSRETVQQYIDKYGDFKLIIDLHRDGIGTIKGAKAKKININGEDVAKLMFVTCENNPRFNKTQKLASDMYNNSVKLFPGLFKPIYTYPSGQNKFNQDLSDNSVLIEVGSDLNTSEQAMASAKYIARLIAEQINK